MAEQKDWEKIEKLIRLANNNPNENEANLAARKACSLLSNVRFHIRTTAQTRTPTGARTGSSPTGRTSNPDPWADIFSRPFYQKPPGFSKSAKFWEEKEREEAARKKQAEEFNNRRAEEEKKRKEAEASKTKEERHWENFGGKVPNLDDYINDILNGKLNFEDLLGQKINWSNIQESPFYKEYKPKTRSDTPKKMKCVKCGKEQETRYIGNPGSFRCFGCWSK